MSGDSTRRGACFMDHAQPLEVDTAEAGPSQREQRFDTTSRHLPFDDAERPFLPWINAVARNAVVDHIRDKQRRAPREISLELDSVPEPSVEPAAPEVEKLSPELSGALEQIPDGQRQAVLLIHLEGLSVEAAAVRAGISKAALKVRAHRGYRALRALLEEQDQ
jgi:RNA polymerase sigma factor (sigma-70 family)